MNTLIKYWSYLVENENKEISFETFLKKESPLFEASMKWPDDYLKKAKDRIMNSPLGKSDWYLENYIDTDLKTFEEAFKTLAKKGNFALGFFLSIINWFIEYSGSDFNKYQEFIEGKLDKIIGILNYVVSQKDDEVSQFHEISKTEKDKDGNPLILKFKKLKDMSWNTFDKEVFQKYSDQISKSVELKNDFSKESDYEAIPIYSYEELYKKFGGDKTGYKGRSEWCHTNGKSTYNSWTLNGRYMFVVFAKKGWENIVPPDPETTTAYDDYGTSLIACLFATKSKKLLHSTLRWNHIIDPAKTKLGASVDNAFKNENDLMNTVGIDLSKNLDEYFKKFKEKNKVTFNKKIFKEDKYGDIDCSNSRLTSLEGAPQKVDTGFNCSYNQLISLDGGPILTQGYFDCHNNRLTSLEGGPVEIEGWFDCSHNQLTSLKGVPFGIYEYFDCSHNQLTSLEGTRFNYFNGEFNCSYNNLTSLKGAPFKEVSGYFICSHNQLTSLEGAPQEVGGGFECRTNRLTSLEGAPWKVGEDVVCNDTRIPEYKIKAYKAYLKLSESEKAPLTKDKHYYPTEEWENKFK